MQFRSLRRRLLAVLVTAAALLGLAAATVPAAAAGQTGGSAAAAVKYPLTIKDYEGRTVTIPAEPKRIISMAPSNTEVLFALGLGSRVVGVDTFSDYPAEANQKTRIGDLFNPNIEKMIALRADLVLAISGSEKMWGKLAELGVPVVIIQPATVPEAIESIRLIGRITNRQEAARALTDKMQAKLDLIEERISYASRRPRVFWEIWHDPFMSAGPGSFMDDMIKRAGGTNLLADAKTPWPEVSAEAIIAADPEVIITSDAEWAKKIRSGEIPGWTRTSAVKHDRVVVIDPNLTNRPGPRIIQGMEMTARAVWPWLFWYWWDM